MVKLRKPVGLPYLEHPGREDGRPCRNGLVEAGGDKENGTNGNQGDSVSGRPWGKCVSVPWVWNSLYSRTCPLAEVEADQQTDDARDHEAESDEVKFTGMFSESLPLVRVEVEEEEQEETGNSASWPGTLSTTPQASVKQRTYRFTKKHHLQLT